MADYSARTKAARLIRPRCPSVLVRLNKFEKAKGEEMKYPIFAVAVGGMLVEGVHLVVAGKYDGGLFMFLGVIVASFMGSCFEAAWNFKKP